MGRPSHPFFTIGHSNRSSEALVALLQESSIELLVDVRAFPRSRSQPQFNADAFEPVLQARSIGYLHMAALGGRRRERLGPDSPNGYWTHPSFRRYADYAMTAEFHAALRELRALGRDRRCAMMCAEAVWWRCHRRLIADYLLAAGEQVCHILGPRRVDPARITEAATPGEGGVLLYPPER